MMFMQAKTLGEVILEELELLSDKQLSNVDDRAHVAMRCESALMSAVIGQFAQMIGGSLVRDNDGEWTIKTGHGHYGTWYKPVQEEENQEEEEEEDDEDHEEADIEVWHEAPTEFREGDNEEEADEADDENEDTSDD
jgi:hypothetical protein